MYKVIAGSRDEDFQNLNQVYGFLVGVFADYRQHHPTVKFFKRWYQARCKRGVNWENYSLGQSSFRIEKIMPSPQQAPLNEM